LHACEEPGIQHRAEEKAVLACLGGDELYALATNPLFPQEATYSRIRWAGLSPSDFEHCTTYENASFCSLNSDTMKRFSRRWA